MTFYYLGIVMWIYFKKAWQFTLRYWIYLAAIVAIFTLPRFIKGPHSPLVIYIENVLKYMAWWTGLGIASSIGLGTGLHTFVLYLGPPIAKLTMAAYDCDAIPNIVPSRWSLDPSYPCPGKSHGHVSFWDILLAVQLESFLWGLGTAIGELPPYFVARAAAISS